MTFGGNSTLVWAIQSSALEGTRSKYCSGAYGTIPILPQCFYFMAFEERAAQTIVSLDGHFSRDGPREEGGADGSPCDLGRRSTTL